MLFIVLLLEIIILLLPGRARSDINFSQSDTFLAGPLSFSGEANFNSKIKIKIFFKDKVTARVQSDISGQFYSGSAGLESLRREN